LWSVHGRLDRGGPGAGEGVGKTNHISFQNFHYEAAVALANILEKHVLVIEKKNGEEIKRKKKKPTTVMSR
jgi:hypothetical protein